MKTKDLERIMKKNGYVFIRNSGHIIWGNGVKTIAIPRGNEVNKMIAKRILKEIGYIG